MPPSMPSPQRTTTTYFEGRDLERGEEIRPQAPDLGRVPELRLDPRSTMRAALVELNIPPSGDATAAYVALPCGEQALRRGASKAGVDILLKRLRGDLAADEEGSKTCLGCEKEKPRSQFVCPEKKCTRQWHSRDRRCLQCVAERKQERDKAMYRWVCSECKEKKKRDDFVRSELKSTTPVCRECNSEFHCHGACGKDLPASAFSRTQLRENDEPRCVGCIAKEAAQAAGMSVASLKRKGKAAVAAAAAAAGGAAAGSAAAKAAAATTATCS
eukprot:gene57789-biopygen89576